MEHHKGIRRLISEGALQIGCPVNEKLLPKFYLYFKELCVWNKKVNLTGLNSEVDIAISLFVDSLAWGLALSQEKKWSVLDIGSGGGFPGIPLKIVYPELEVTLVEPQLKKVAFLHHIIGILDLGPVEVLPRRVEDLVKDQSFALKYDCMVTKALRAECVLPFGRSLLRCPGKVVLCRSQPLDFSIQEYGMKLVREVSYELPHGFGKRILSILETI